MIHDILANALSILHNASKAGKLEVAIQPLAKTTTVVLDLLKKEGYVKEIERIESISGGSYRVKLAGAINKVGVIKPRFSVKVADLEKFEKRYLPAQDFGRIILSTPKGVMTHIDAKKNHQGGTLLAYVY